jgi:hypothetical protein
MILAAALAVAVVLRIDRHQESRAASTPAWEVPSA